MTVVNTVTGEIVETLNYEVHPVAALFPYIEGDAFREFVEDIRVNGQREPVVLDGDGRLLDGRNRARACQVLGIDVKETRYSDGDAEGWIISHNVHRRHLTESQRAMVAARLSNLARGGDRGNQYLGGKGSIDPLPHSTSRDEAARQLNVGVASVGRAKAVLSSGDEATIKAVESGEVSVTAAAAKVRATKESTKPKKQAAAVRVSQIRELADKGASSEQIAKKLGVVEDYVRRLARDNGVLIVADEIRRGVRRLNHDVILGNTAESLEVAAMALRDIDSSQLNRDEAVERLDSLTSSINAIATAIKKIKESFHD